MKIKDIEHEIGRLKVDIKLLENSITTQDKIQLIRSKKELKKLQKKLDKRK